MLFHREALRYYMERVDRCLEELSKTTGIIPNTAEFNLAPEVKHGDSSITDINLVTEVVERDIPELEKHSKNILKELTSGRQHILAQLQATQSLPGLDKGFFLAIERNTESLIAGCSAIIEAADKVPHHMKQLQTNKESMKALQQLIQNVFNHIVHMGTSSREVGEGIKASHDILSKEIIVLSEAMRATEMEMNALSWLR